MNFLYNLNLVLGHTLVFELNQEWLVIKDAKCNLDPGNPPNPNIAANAQQRATIRNLPGLLNILNEYQPKMAEGQYQAARQVSPEYAALDIAMKNAFGGLTSDANAAVANRNASNLANIFQTGGRELVTSADQAARIADPEYYQTRAAVGKGAQDLLGGMDPNRLTPAELENAVRGVNRTNIATGNVTPSQTTAISNAMTFGDELTKKRDAFGRALAGATGTLPAVKSGVDTFRQVTGQPGTSGLGSSQFAGVTPVEESQTAAGQATNLTNAGVQNWTNLANNQDYRTTGDRYAAAGMLTGGNLSGYM